jgi:peptidoglycan/LPS O-acetylase OafA/YrhL
MVSPVMQQRDYRPDIDGLRALAVIGVILFHANLGLTGGYVGVDVFFVISGFLITGLILKEQAAERFSLADFWERRIRRILPALAVTIGCTLLAGVAVLFPGELIELVKSAMAQLLIGANFFFWRHAGYFDTPSELQPLLHTWSLAVEEQFYLVFPLLLIACRSMSRWRLQLVLCSIGAVSFGLSVWGSYAHPTATFYLLPSRGWELLIGSLLATASTNFRAPRRVNELLSVAGLGAIAFTFWSYGTTTRFPGANALLPCVGTALLIWSSTGERTTVGKLLSLRPIVFVGLISYSLYLWHWPVLSFIRYRISDNPTVATRLAALMLSFALACLSWRFVETPFRQKRPGWTRSRVFAAAFITTAGLFAFSAAIWQLGGLPQRFPKEILRFAEANEFPQQFETDRLEKIERDQLPVLGKVDGTHASFLLWGDSHAPPAASAVNDLALKYKIWGYVAANPGMTPLLGTWRPTAGKESVLRNQAVLDFVRRKKIKNVILASDWEVNTEGRNSGSLDSLIVDDAKQAVSSPNSLEVFRRQLSKTVEALQHEGAAVWILRQVPIQRDIPSQYAFSAWLHHRELPEFGVTLPEHVELHTNANRIISDVAAGRVHILDPADVCFDSTGHSLVAENGRSYYWDRTHLTSFGAKRLLEGLFEPVIQQIATASKMGERTDERERSGN